MDVKIFLKNLSTTKVSEHIPSAFSMSTIWSFKSIEKKHNVYRGIDFTKSFCQFLTLFMLGV